MRILLFIFLATITSALHAGKIDQALLKKITGTKWELVEEKKPGLFSKKNKAPIKQQITFSTGSILFDSDDQHYQCNYTLKKSIEFWMYCSEPDQYIYKIHSLDSKVLVMDMLVKDKSGKYYKKKRMIFNALK
jgi:hypothetical protein